MSYLNNITFCFLLYSSASGQVANYIINPGFEDVAYSSTLSPSGGIVGWAGIDSTQSAFLYFSNGAPFYNLPNSSFGFQLPKEGNNIVGSTFFCSTCTGSLRWYPRNRLKMHLTSGKKYCGRFYVVNTNNTSTAIESFAMLAGTVALDTIKHCKVPLTYLAPQIEYQSGIVTDTLNWTPISGTFVAAGNEKYVVLGNFRSDVTTQTTVINTTHLPTLINDVYIDAVSLVEEDLSAFAGNDTNIVVGDSVFIGRQADVGIDYACQWFQLPNDTIPIDTVAGLWVKPTTKTTYVVKQQLWCSGVKWDTVTIHFNTVSTFEEKLRHVKLSPNPNGGKIILSGLPDHETIRLSVTDVSGRVFRSVAFQSAGSYTAELEVPDGIYLLRIESRSGSTVRKVVVQR